MVGTLDQILQSNFGTFYIFCMAIIGACVLIIFTAIIIDFVKFHPNKKVKRQKKNPVETGTMTLFFIFFYLFIRFNIGIINYNYIPLRLGLLIFGTIVIVFGTYINVKGRFVLGKNWANHIKIYKDHKMVTAWPYNLVRHPLYASLIWMFYAASLIYLNWIAFLLTTLVFVPMMIYRAKQEELLLSRQFKNYKTYINNVGRFFPKMKL
jgi:protein-S-isoprenylcysteine O-methyltransferase Ste14